MNEEEEKNYNATTINDFIKHLQSMKSELKDLPLVIIAPNGLQFKPKAKILLEGKYQNYTDPATKMVITYE